MKRFALINKETMTVENLIMATPHDVVEGKLLVDAGDLNVELGGTFKDNVLPLAEQEIEVVLAPIAKPVPKTVGGIDRL